ncbi:MAG: hypothetical protein JW861_08490 [Bacteroidales bacterium]|nr:hypothetical protein [Bacteroidales bacterium]
MKSIIRVTLAFLMLSGFSAHALDTYPQQDVDYESDFEYLTDDKGNDIVTYFLGNLSGERIMFFDFSINPTEYEYQVLNDLPDDVLIVGPYEKAMYFKCISVTGRPGFTWNAEFLEDDAASVDHPASGRDYVFYYTYKETGEDIEYVYFLKNISPRLLRFSGFNIDENSSGYTTTRELPFGSLVLPPDDHSDIMRFSIPSSGDAPYVEWNVRFIEDEKEYEVMDYSFCDGILQMIRASADENFSSVRGNMLDEGGGLFESYESMIHIEGMRDESIIDMMVYYTYWAYIGDPGSFGEIQGLFDDYRSRIKECLPSGTEEDLTWGKTDDEINIKAEYTGDFDGIPLHVNLEIDDTYEPEIYRLHLTIEGDW